MNLYTLKSELNRLQRLVEAWQTVEDMTPIERDLVLARLRDLYAAVRFGLEEDAQPTNVDREQPIETTAVEEPEPEPFDGVAAIDAAAFLALDTLIDELPTPPAEEQPEPIETIDAEPAAETVPDEMPMDEAPIEETAPLEMEWEHQPAADDAMIAQEVEAVEEELEAVEVSAEEELPAQQTPADEPVAEEPTPEPRPEATPETEVAPEPTSEPEIVPEPVPEVVEVAPAPEPEPALESEPEPELVEVTPEPEPAPEPEVVEVAPDPEPQPSLHNLFGEPERATDAHVRHRHKQRVIMSLYDTAPEQPRRRETKLRIENLIPPESEVRVVHNEPEVIEMSEEELTRPRSEAVITPATEHGNAPQHDEETPSVVLTAAAAPAPVPAEPTAPATLGERLPHVQTLGEKLAAERETVGELHREPITDLRRAVGINDKFLLIRDLFGGNGSLYEITIRRLNEFDNLDDCLIYIAEHFNWNPNSDGAQLMMELLERKYLG